MTSTQPEPAVWFPAIRAGSGADVFTERLVDGLQQRGIRAEITWLPLRAEYAPWTVPIPKPPEWANIVHVNSWLPPHFLPKGLPVAVTIHHAIHHSSAQYFKTRLQRVYHRRWVLPIEVRNIVGAQTVAAVSRHVSGEVRRLFGRMDVIVIANGIDTECTFTPGPPRPFHKPFRLLYVGNWRRLKGCDLLGPVMERLGSDFELLYTADRAGAHKRYQLPSNTRCLERLGAEALSNAYREADALLFPSRSEGQGLVVIEAMACGLSTIASDAAPLSELIENGVTGLLCPQDDIQAFAGAARRLSADAVLWRHMRIEARHQVEIRFSLETMVERYCEIYRKTRSEFVMYSHGQMP